DQIIKLDDQNPQIASRLATPLTRWRKFSVARQTLMTEQLQRIHGKESLSKDLREIVEKSLP
ncbi:aminopeptidase N C-terminal domain-containing protein, partial [Oleiphilus sp. HI0079]